MKNKYTKSIGQNGYLIRLDLTPEEGKALDELATRECRLTHEQGRYLIREMLIELGLLANDSAASQQGVNLKEIN